MDNIDPSEMNEIRQKLHEHMLKLMNDDLRAAMGLGKHEISPETKEAHRRVDDLETWLRIKDGIRRLNTIEARKEFLVRAWEHPEQYVMYMNPETAVGIREYLARKGILQDSPQIKEIKFMDDGEIIFARTEGGIHGAE